MKNLLAKLRITARLYGGFGILVAIGFAVAALSVWQFSNVGDDVSTLARVSSGMARNAEVESIANDMQRFALVFKIFGDDEAVKGFGIERTKAVQMLDVAIEKSALAERRKIFGQVKANIEAYQVKFDRIV